jgi:exosortase E/protease (VPEID-CTERM system)
MVGRGLSVLAVAAVLIRARPAAFARFLRAAGGARTGRWIALHAAGVALLVLPLVVTGGQGLAERFALAAMSWAPGAAAAAVGGVLWLAPPRGWAALERGERRAIVPIFAAAALLPDLAEAALPLWDLRGLTAATFLAVFLLLRGTSAEAAADPATFVIGVDDFFVHIARQCSGVEGFALVTAFTALYAVLFRAEVRPSRFALVVLPLGLLASWWLNVLRIAALILIGAHLSPGIAVNGFHSYAGWMFFVALALGMLWLVQRSDWLHRRPVRAVAPALPLRADPVAAAILPFVAFMAAGVVAGALFSHPDLGYPLVALVLAGTVALFGPHFRRILPEGDPVPLAAGVAVGAGWIALDRLTPAAGGEALAAGLAALPAWALAGWIAARLAGTVILVPLVEEAFFRGYLLARLDRGGLAWRVAAVAVSTVLFAALHGRWLAAALAGLVFALAMLRRGRLGDAVAAHMAANAVVALWATMQGDWSAI